MIRKIRKIMPGYGWALAGAALCLNGIVYFGSRLFTADRFHCCLACPLDERIPLIPWFIAVYFLAFGYWGIGYLLICRQEREIAFWIMGGELLAKTAALVCFLALPTAMGPLRPDPASLDQGGIWESLTVLLYRMDPADNLFPSIHCLESWICFRGALCMKKIRGWYGPLCLAATLLIFASTVFLRQHVLADIAGGVAAAELGLYCSGRLLKKGCFQRFGILGSIQGNIPGSICEDIPAGEKGGLG